MSQVPVIVPWMTRRTTALPAALSALLLLGACGGGGSGGEDTTADTTKTTAEEVAAEEKLTVTVTIHGSGLNARWSDFKALLAMSGSGAGKYTPAVGNICMGKGEADLDHWKGGAAYEMTDEAGTTLLAGKLGEGRVVAKSGATPDGCKFEIEGDVPTSAKFYRLSVGGQAVETFARADAQTADWNVEVDL